MPSLDDMLTFWFVCYSAFFKQKYFLSLKNNNYVAFYKASVVVVNEAVVGFFDCSLIVIVEKCRVMLRLRRLACRGGLRTLAPLGRPDGRQIRQET
jgi:hypothetical protein